MDEKLPCSLSANQLSYTDRLVLLRTEALPILEGWVTLSVSKKERRKRS